MTNNSNNTNSNNNDKTTSIEMNPNIALLIRLLSNPTSLQQMLTSTAQTTLASNAIVGVVNTSHEFPTFPVSVGDFILQKISESILGNWAQKEGQRCLQSRHSTPPKRKNSIPPLRNKRVVLTPSSTLSSLQNELPNTITASPAASITNSIETDSVGTEDNIDAELFLSELPETNDNAELYSLELSAPIIRSKKPIRKLSDISYKPLTQVQQSGKKKAATANLKCATRKQAKKIESDNDEAKNNIDVESDNDEAEDNIGAESDNDKAENELLAPITRSKKPVRKLSDISYKPLTQVQQSGKKKAAIANLKRATRKQAKKIESDNDEAEDNIDVESDNNEAEDAPITQSKKPIRKLLGINNQPLTQMQQSGKKKTATTNPKHATKKQVKSVESDNDKAEDNIDAESEQPEVDNVVSTSFKLPARSKKAIGKLSDISNRPLTQVQKSGSDSGKEKTAMTNSKRANKKQAMKKTESKRIRK
ncbi:hypothetical protein C2G38_2226953 [Gigaspora rosea]|uniref:Uncharacterized protein n=1 Tax=Gigaspora rosea TaxID=44941 RepID=A0A397TXJ9_9GLOM|nr:hypothetical protein C2G38_2226953 [Gigaspora rosea]